MTAATDTLPAAPHIEREVAGALMLDAGKAYGILAGRIDSDCFIDPLCKAVWDTCSTLDAAGQWTSANVTQALSDSGRLESVGGPSEIIGLIEMSPPSLQILRSHADTLKTTSNRRKTVVAASAMAQMAADKAAPLESALEAMQEHLIEVSSTGTGSKPEDAKTIVKSMAARLSGLVPRASGVRTGIKALDDYLMGIQKKALCIVAARPGVGKSCLLHCIADRATMDGSRVLYITLEMTREEVFERLIIGGAHVDMTEHAAGRASNADRAKILARSNDIMQRTLWMHDAAGASITQIRAIVRSMVARHKIDTIIIDYAQLITAQAKDRVAEIGKVSRGLKMMAKENDAAIIVAAQLNRASENRSGEAPRLSDLRESGDLEQDADIVVLMHRDPDEDGLVCSNVAKHRGGRTGTGRMLFIPQYTKFLNPARDNEQ